MRDVDHDTWPARIVRWTFWAIGIVMASLYALSHPDSFWVFLQFAVLVGAVVFMARILIVDPIIREIRSLRSDLARRRDFDEPL